MEDDTGSMIKAAKAKARHMARKTDLTYQQALDKVARDAGREHWAAFQAYPTRIPHDWKPSDTTSDAARTDDVEATERRLHEMLENTHFSAQLAAMRVGHQRYNILLPEDVCASSQSLDQLVEDTADILIEKVEGSGYFHDRARAALAAFMHWEILSAGMNGREASLAAMVAALRMGIHESSRSATLTGDRFGEWLASVSGQLTGNIADHQPGRTVMELALMDPKERSSVFAVVDRSLSAFAAPRMAA